MPAFDDRYFVARLEWAYTTFERQLVHYMKSDWKRWNRAERVGAVMLAATCIIFYGLSIIRALAG